MTPDYERAKYAADRLSVVCDLQTHSLSKYYAERAKLHLSSAAATMGFVLAPMMPEQHAPEKKPETGTLAELNVKPGDVVSYKSRVTYTIWGWEGEKCFACHFDDKSKRGAALIRSNRWRIVSRASQPAPDDLRAAYDREVLE